MQGRGDVRQEVEESRDGGRRRKELPPEWDPESCRTETLRWWRKERTQREGYGERRHDENPTPQAATANKTPRTSRAPHSEDRRGTVDSVRIRTPRGGRESRRAGDRDRRRPSHSRNQRRIMSPCRRRARRGETEKRLRGRRAAAGRSRGDGRRDQKRASPFDDGRRDFAERANSGSWIRSLKGGQIRALEDGKGIGIVSSEGEKGRIIPRRDISPGGVKIPIDLILVPRERGKDKNQWTGK